MNNNGSWLPEEDFKDLSANFFDDLINHIDDFPLEDIETINDEEDWGAEFKNLIPPSLDVLSSLTSTDFTGNGQRVRVQNRVPIVKESTSLEASSTTDSSSADVKVSKLFQSSSPVSVLETPNGFVSSQNQNSALKLSFPIKGVRNKRKRPSLLRLTFLHSFASAAVQQFANAPDESDSEDMYLPSENSAKKKRKKNKSQSAFTAAYDNPEVLNSDGTVRTCSHCQTTRTPQWREGPNGPKTLCNACGVRFRSGRLLPEYRPASSPTFIPTVHSNCHRKIVEMRRKESSQLVSRKIRVVTSQG